MRRAALQEQNSNQDFSGLGTEQIRSELQRVIASEAFDASERNRSFLTFVVEETLAGRSQYIKGYTVARGVFQRDDDFDPQLDPVVRIEASRLRRSLERYYLTAGKADSIRIELPKGGYVPRFAMSAETEGQDSARSAPVATASEADTRGAIAAGHPSIIVFPFDNLSAEPELDLIARGIAEELVTRLTSRQELTVVSADVLAKLAHLCNLPKIDCALTFAITGSLRMAKTRLRTLVRLVAVEHGNYLWAETFDRDLASDDVWVVQEQIADLVAARLVTPVAPCEEPQS
jgi:adenylate cyclase